MPLETIRQLWDRNLRLFPDQDAVVFQGRARSYGEIVSDAGRLASALVARGVRKQDRIALLARNRGEWFDYYAACEMYGFIASTLNFRLAAPELSYIVNDSLPSVLIFEDDYIDLVAALRPLLSDPPQFICIGDAPEWATGWNALLAEGDPAGPPLSPDLTDAVRLIYTSGTTGKPKGVLRSQAADLALARICAITSDMASGCRELIMMPMFHVGGQSMASGAHWAGGTVYLQRDFDPETILRSIDHDAIDTIHVTPTIVQSLIDHPSFDRFDLTSLKTVCYAAAAMPVPLLERGLKRLGPVFANCYGSTEAGAAIILPKRFHRLDGDASDLERIGSLGQEHHESRVCILDDTGAEVAIGEVGEIALQTAAMMSGYWKNVAATEAALGDGWLRTGDVGRMDSRGFVYLVDRKADMVISGGENIYSREVEDALLRHPDVAAAAVIGVPDEFWGEAVLGVVVLKEGSTLSGEDLIAQTGQYIARYKLPKKICVVDALPLLPSAKIDKPSLRRDHSPPLKQSEGIGE